MTWMTMLASEPWESTLVTRTLVSLKSSSLMRSLMAYACVSLSMLQLGMSHIPSGLGRRSPCPPQHRKHTGSACCRKAVI